MKKYLFIFIYIIGVNLWAQVERDKDSLLLVDKYIVFEGDTLLVELDEVQLLKKLKFNSYNDRRYYYWFRKKTLKAYPYAMLAAERLFVLEERISKIKSKRKRRRYIKLAQKYLEGEFTDQLKKLTRTEGRILIKLIHRQTGHTTFDLIKEFRSGWKAFWYNTTAKMFKLSLKSEYDPVTEKEDYLIEDILQRAFADGVLVEQETKLDHNYFEMDTRMIKIYDKK